MRFFIPHFPRRRRVIGSITPISIEVQLTSHMFSPGKMRGHWLIPVVATGDASSDTLVVNTAMKEAIERLCQGTVSPPKLRICGTAISLVQ